MRLWEVIKRHFAAMRRRLGPAEGGRGRVLALVPDDFNRRAVDAMLRQCGWVPTFAESHAQAVHASFESGFDLVLVDLSCPSFGLATARRLVVHPVFQHVPIVALVDAADGDLTLHACEQGCVGTITRPLSAVRLAGQLETLSRAAPPDLASALR